VKLTWEPMDLELRHTFTISHSSMEVARNVLVRLEHDGITGMGEAPPSEYYGQNRESVMAALSEMAGELGGDPFMIEDIVEHLGAKFPGDSAAVAAVDMALHDWLGKKLGVPLWRILGLDPGRTPVTSFTIGIDTTAKMIEKVREAGEYPTLKVKVGTERDDEILSAIRRETDKTIRVDANAAWEAQEAIEKIRALQKYDIEFVEQPVPPGNPEALRTVRTAVDVPVISDESSVVPEDVPGLFGCVDGINIKLSKCGGIRRALKMIHTAKSAGLRVMLGCMIESSVAITAAAQLSPLVDYADLDGNLLISNDIASGVKVEKGKLVLPDGPGLGIEMASK
jgi:L-alanine-DL-glutamate epimerase-like enolase superfamily enzyme